MSGSTANKEYSRALTKSVVFDSKATKWRDWSAKFLAVADVHGYKGVLLGTKMACPTSQVTKSTEEEKISKPSPILQWNRFRSNGFCQDYKPSKRICKTCVAEPMPMLQGCG